MADPLITLTSDFGAQSPYVASMTGVILSINPAARLVDLSHQLPPQDLYHANYFLGSCLPYFPVGTIHVAVIDPGVGTDRIPLLVRAGGQFLLGPDNGIFTTAIDRFGEAECWRLVESAYWRESISSTFHGRDIFAPVAAHLSLGLDPARLGPAAHWTRLDLPTWSQDGAIVRGAVQFIDDFGNLISNIPIVPIATRPPEIIIAGRQLQDVQWVRTYGEAQPGSLVVLGSSDGFVEIARVNGSAAEVLGVSIGAIIELRLSGPAQQS